jgi:hypothetical protein
MRVNDERKPKTVPFSTIKCGEPFADDEGDFMMRIIGNGDVSNAVNLETGHVYSFDAEDPVIRLNRAAFVVYD